MELKPKRCLISERKRPDLSQRKKPEVKTRPPDPLPNPYQMKNDANFKEKLNRAKNARLTKAKQQQQQQKDTKFLEPVPPSQPKPKPKVASIDVTALKQMQSLTNRLNKVEGEGKPMTEDERKSWYAQRGYTFSANGVLVPPDQPEYYRSEEVDLIMKSNIDKLAQTHIAETGKEVEEALQYLSASSSEEDVDLVESESDEEIDEDQRWVASLTFEEEDEELADMYKKYMQKVYPTDLAMRFLNTDPGYGLMDMECYGNFGLEDSAEVQAFNEKEKECSTSSLRYKNFELGEGGSNIQASSEKENVFSVISPLKQTATSKRTKDCKRVTFKESTVKNDHDVNGKTDERMSPTSKVLDHRKRIMDAMLNGQKTLNPFME